MTRTKLLRAGERLFSSKGVDGALVRDIVRLAGQANDSAIHYHFGSRQGLLEAILVSHIEQMEKRRGAALENIGLGSRDLNGMVTAIVEPTAERLSSQEGRDFLRIIVQVADRAAVRERAVPGPIKGTALAKQLELLTDCCREFLPEPVALERISSLIMLLTAVLSERARHIEECLPLSLNQETFVANLIAMIVGLLRAPAP